LDQGKCLEQRTETQVVILHEIQVSVNSATGIPNHGPRLQDFLKRRAEIDLDYSKQLDKLVKSVMIKHKGEKQKRATWSLYSTCNLW